MLRLWIIHLRIGYGKIRIDLEIVDYISQNRWYLRIVYGEPVGSFNMVLLSHGGLVRFVCGSC